MLSPCISTAAKKALHSGRLENMICACGAGTLLWPCTFASARHPQSCALSPDALQLPPVVWHAKATANLRSSPEHVLACPGRDLTCRLTRSRALRISIQSLHLKNEKTRPSATGPACEVRCIKG